MIHDEFRVDCVDDPIEIFRVVDMAIVVDIQVSDEEILLLTVFRFSWTGFCMRTIVRISSAW